MKRAKVNLHPSINFKILVGLLLVLDMQTNFIAYADVTKACQAHEQYFLLLIKSRLYIIITTELLSEVNAVTIALQRQYRTGSIYEEIETILVKISLETPETQNFTTVRSEDSRRISSRETYK